MTWWEYGLWFLLLSSVFYVSYLVVVYDFADRHEAAHQAIDRGFGINTTSEVYYAGFVPAYAGITTNTSVINLTVNERSLRRELHAQNEIVGYNVKSMIASLFVVAYLLGIIILIARRPE